MISKLFLLEQDYRQEGHTINDKKILSEVRKIVDATWIEASSLLAFGSTEKAQYRVAQGMDSIDKLLADNGFPEQNSV